jgi:hypothetical protein
MNWAQDSYKSWAVVNMVINHQVASNVNNILTIREIIGFSRRQLHSTAAEDSGLLEATPCF